MCPSSTYFGLDRRLAVVVVGVWALSAHAEVDVGVGATTTTVGEVRTDNENGDTDDDNYGVVLERLNVTGNVGDVSANARVDAAGFLTPPNETFQNQLRLERLNLRYTAGDFTFEAGDHYQQLGRGIVLSVRKLQEQGIDIAIRGGRLRYQSERHAITLFGGVANSANVDAVNQRAVEDKNDILGGGNYELSASKRARIGFFGLYNQAEERLLDEFTDFTISAGSYIDASTLFDWLSVYLEVDVQERYLAGEPQRGSAAYASTELRFWDLTLFSEFMLLYEFEQKGSRNDALGTRFDYNRPPTLERIDQEVINNRNLAGGRLRAEYYFAPLDLLLYVNTMGRINDPLEDSLLYQFHGFGGFELTFEEGASRLAGAVGYRHEQQPTQPRPIKTMAHFDIDFLQRLWWELALHVTSNTQYRIYEGDSFWWGSTFVGMEKAGLGGVTFEFGYDGFNRAPGVRNTFYAFIGNLELSDKVRLSGTIGNQRGGIKCVAGVCREFPAFSGARLALITRF